ncbi:NUDIX domain-containing protein [Candidatus Dependentiae bacterium]|nr:NUDIX domain-containing protein [Candidatus Dependentiae bacterium]
MMKSARILFFLAFSFAKMQADKNIDAGILPYYYDENGKAYFLLGKEPNGVWADFGGKHEQGEYSSETAAREFSEETRYVFGKYAGKINLLEKAEKSQLKDSVNYIKGRITAKLEHPKKYYIMYLAQVDFIPAEMFTDAPKVPHYEKKDYEWVPAKKFIKAIEMSSDRNNTFFETKQIRKEFFDTLKHEYSTLKDIFCVQKKKSMKYTKSKKDYSILEDSLQNLARSIHEVEKKLLN